MFIEYKFWGFTLKAWTAIEMFLDVKSSLLEFWNVSLSSQLGVTELSLISVVNLSSYP